MDPAVEPRLDRCPGGDRRRPGRAVTGAELPLAAGQPRQFARLLATQQYEAWLIAWAPADGLQLHDHGGSAGAIHVAQGRLAQPTQHNRCGLCLHMGGSINNQERGRK